MNFKSLVLFFSIVTSWIYAQQNFQSVEEANLYINNKIQQVTNPGKVYNQTLNLNTSAPGIINLQIISHDNKGKLIDSTTYEFIIEHLNKNKIETISKSKELTLRIYALNGFKLLKKTTNSKTVYTSSMDIYCSDLQMIRDLTDAFTYLTDNIIGDRVFIKDEDEAYNWLETNLKNSFTCNGISYEMSLNIDHSNNNKLTYNLHSTKGKTQKNQQYEFYLTDFNIKSFTATEKTDRLLTFTVDYGDSIVDYHIPSYDVMPFKFNTANNVFAVNLTTTNQIKAVRYMEDGVQKSFVEKFDIVVGNPRLAEGLISVLFRIKTGNYDKEKIVNTSSNTSSDIDPNYNSSINHTTSNQKIKFTNDNLKDYTNKWYENICADSDFLKLNQDNTYIQIHVPYTQDMASLSITYGAFTIKNGILTLTPKKCKSYNPYNTGQDKKIDDVIGNTTEMEKLITDNWEKCELGSSLKVEVIQDNNSLYYTQYLKVNNKTMFGVPGTEPIEQQRVYNGTSVISINVKKSTAKSTTNLRATPDVKGKKVDYQEYCDEDCSLISKDEVLFPVARTTKKQKVGKVEDYWYVVLVWDGLGCRSEGWVHGQYIKF